MVATMEVPCITWQGARQPNGYGKLGRNGHTILAHRYAYETQIGPVPEGLELDHLCSNRACVEVQHLEPVTRAENVRRAAVRNYSPACPHGHVRTPENTYVYRGYTYCRTCNAESHARRRR